MCAEQHMVTTWSTYNNFNLKYEKPVCHTVMYSRIENFIKITIPIDYNSISSSFERNIFELVTTVIDYIAQCEDRTAVV